MKGFRSRSARPDDELIPEKGKDEAYDEVKREIRKLERELDDQLEKLEGKTG